MDPKSGFHFRVRCSGAILRAGYTGCLFKAPADIANDFDNPSIKALS